MRQKTRAGVLLGSCLLVGMIVAQVGCSPDASDPDVVISQSNKTNIQRLRNLYVMYQMNHGFQGPKDEAEFKEYIKAADISILEPMGVDPAKVDELFISERDNEPFVVKYGVPTTSRGSGDPVIFEKTGVGGKKMVAFLNMTEREVDDAEYQQLLNQ